MVWCWSISHRLARVRRHSDHYGSLLMVGFLRTSGSPIFETSQLTSPSALNANSDHVLGSLNSDVRSEIRLESCLWVAICVVVIAVSRILPTRLDRLPMLPFPDILSTRRVRSAIELSSTAASMIFLTSEISASVKSSHSASSSMSSSDCFWDFQLLRGWRDRHLSPINSSTVSSRSSSVSWHILVYPQDKILTALKKLTITDIFSRSC